MYSREMGGIRSDGQLYGMKPEQLSQDYPPQESIPSSAVQTAERQRQGYREAADTAQEYRETADRETDSRETASYAADSRMASASCAPPKGRGLLNLSFLQDIKTEDLLLLAVAFLLFTDSGEGENNDLLILLVGLLLLL